MRHYVFALVTCLVVITGLGPSSAAAVDPNLASLVQSEKMWMKAMVSRDELALRSSMNPAFTLSGLAKDTDMKPLPAAGWIDNTLHRLKIDFFHFENARPAVIGSFGIFRTGYRWKATFDGGQFDESGQLVDFWIKQDGRWQVIARVLGDAPAIEHKR